MSAFISNLTICAAEHYYRLAHEFGQYRVSGSTASDFALALRHVLRFTDITPAQLAGGIQASEGTIKRWANGEAIPAPLIRDQVLDWASDELSRRADTIKRAYERYLAPEG